MKIDLTNLYSKLGRYIPHLLIIGILLLLFDCNFRSKQGVFFNELIKSKNKDLINNQKKIKSLEKDIVLYNKIIQDLNNTVLNKEKEIQENKIKTEKQKKEVQKYTTNQIVNFYQKRYHTNEVKSLDNKVIFSDTICKKNIIELIDFDGIKTELQSTQEVLLVERQKIASKDSIISNKDKQKLSLESAVKTLESINSDYDMEIKQQRQELRAEKRKTTLWKLITVATIFGSSYLIVK